MMRFTVRSAEDVQRVTEQFSKMTDQSITDDNIALQIRTGVNSWKNVSFDEALAWPFDDEPTELAIYDLDAVE